jgi:mRNA interferase RelE/StbE
LKVEFRESFLKDLRSIKDRNLLAKVRETIESLESASKLLDIRNIKKLRGGKEYYRIRLGEYRLGIVLEDDSLVLVRFLDRKEIYRDFP